MKRLENMPVPLLPTFVGALTLSNVYSGMGYTWIRHLTMWAATIIILLYVKKSKLSYSHSIVKKIKARKIASDKCH